MGQYVSARTGECVVTHEPGTALVMNRTFLAAGVAILALLLGAGSATAATTLRTPHPSWFTPKFKKQVKKAGKRGKPKPSAGPSATDVCPGIDPNSPTPATTVVSAGTCEVYPYGCTANFIYSGGGGYYIGTAGHCVDKVGQD